jgi:small-conductance mechanosensitive channel
MRGNKFFLFFKKEQLPAAGRAFICLLAVFCILIFFSSARAQDESISGPGKEDASGSAPGLYQTLAESFDQALEMENQDLERVSDALTSLEAESAEMENRVNQIQLMVSTYSNLVLLPSIEIQDLEQAENRQGIAMSYLQEQIQKSKEEKAKWEKALEETVQQIDFYKNQKAEITSQPPNISVNLEIVSRLDTLINLLDTKRKQKEKILDIYSKRLERQNSLLQTLEPLSVRIHEQIEIRKKSRILEHEPNPVSRIFKGELKENALWAVDKISKLISHSAWQKPGVVSWEEYGLFLALFLFLLGVFQAVLYGCGKYCATLMQRSFEDDRFWHYIIAKLIKKSLPWAGTIAFLYFYPVRAVYRMTPFFALLPLLIDILILIMVVRWGKIFLRALAARISDPLFHYVYRPFSRLLFGILIFGVGYLLISNIICAGCIGLTAWRLVFEILLLGWFMHFFHVFYKFAADSVLSDHLKFPVLKPAMIVVGCAVVLPGLVAELAGFGGLASYWYSGIEKTIILLFWVFILYRVLKESDVAAHIERSDEIDEDELGPRPYPVRWLVVRLLRIGTAAGAFFLLFMAWGAPKTFLADFLYAINYEFTVGDFRLSLIGFVYAIIVLLFVYTFNVIFKEFLRLRMLKQSDMEPGLQDSILRISGYIFWTIGILVALRTVGISATALTVVFGALGIGIGFGLQNIFNNFLSGIILLFERPIQVGDVIEIGTVWGTVREINVRATQVRTFDNADLIIPNADFISQSLTNWSFRDARVRRSVTVGVAYGSDIELVRQVLMDVAYQHPRILRRPHPEVLFSDFAESSLVFKLRFWVHIDWFIVVETDVRFDIDKKFKENGIVIPYPKRDIYLKTDDSTSGTLPGAQEPE